MIVTFFVLLLTNVWIWKTFTFSGIAGIFLLISSILLFVYLKNKRIIFLFGSVLLILLTVPVTGGFRKIELINGTQEEQLMLQRLKEYPPITALPIAHWLEERPETIAVYRLSQNFAEVMDPNLYFFANHPRERVGITEAEKLPYILLPFLVYGIFLAVSEKLYKYLSLCFGIPLIYYIIYGTGNGIEPFLLYPFLVTASYLGVSMFLRKTKIIFKVIFWILYFLILVQGILYAIY